MKKIIIFLIALFLILSLFSFAFSAPVQKTIIPAEAEWVFHFDLEKFFTTQFFKLFIGQEYDGKTLKKLKVFYSQFKLDVQKDVKSLSVFGSEKDENTAVVCIKGKFDRDHLLGLLKHESSHREIPYDKHTIHKWNHDEFGVFARDDLVLIGKSEMAIKKALDVVTGKRENITSSPMNSYFKEVPSDAFIFSIAGNLSTLMLGLPKPFVLKKTKSAMMTAAEKEGRIVLKLDFETETVEDADKIKKIIDGLMAMADLYREEKGIDWNFVENLDFRLEGNKVKVEASYPVQDLVDVFFGKKALPFLLACGALGSFS